MNKRTLSLTLALALPTSLSFAQRPAGPPPGGPQGPPPDQQPGNRPPRDPNGDRNRPQPLPPLPIEHALDADDDGIISADEIANSPDRLATLDKNKDGKLVPEEFLARRPDGPPPGGDGDGDRPRQRNTTSDRNRPAEPFPGQKPPRDGDAPKDGPKDAPKDRPDRPRDGDKPKLPPPPLVGALDANGDGVISADEVADAPNALLTLDKNKDGQLGPKEIHAAPRNEGGDGPKPPLPPREGN